MGSIFQLKSNRTILIANQNCFPTPIKHPSRTLNEHIISYVLYGEWELEIGREIIRAPKDTVFIQPARVAHTGLTLCPPNTNTMFVHFSREEGDQYTEVEAPKTPEGCLYIGNAIDASANYHIKNFLLKIIEETTRGSSIKASVYLNLLLCELAEGQEPMGNGYAQQIRKMIDRNIGRNITNQEIANRLNISVRTAETSFSAFFGISIHQYMIKEKMEHAKFCLEYYPNMKIHEIAKNLGFYDEYHFSRQFKRSVGLSPREYGKSILATKDTP